MARCDQGYLCDVCGDEVELLEESDLYLGYVIGTVSANELLARHERHLRCNPAQAQFIVDPDFPLVVVEGPFDKRNLDPNYVAQQEALLTRGWRRLRELQSKVVPINEYPLPEVQARAAK